MRDSPRAIRKQTDTPDCEAKYFPRRQLRTLLREHVVSVSLNTVIYVCIVHNNNNNNMRGARIISSHAKAQRKNERACQANTRGRHGKQFIFTGERRFRKKKPYYNAFAAGLRADNVYIYILYVYVYFIDGQKPIVRVLPARLTHFRVHFFFILLPFFTVLLFSNIFLFRDHYCDFLCTTSSNIVLYTRRATFFFFFVRNSYFVFSKPYVYVPL